MIIATPLTSILSPERRRSNRSPLALGGKGEEEKAFPN
jgi:hypothetical protein